MKKALLTAVITLAGTLVYKGQDISDNAIGLRLGGGNGFGSEISYQRALSDNNRLEVDLGILSDDTFDGFKTTGIYQWVWEIENGFQWYAGAGGGLAVISIDNEFRRLNTIEDSSETFLYAAGQIGIEYNFNIPLQLSFDIRPELYFGDFLSGIESNYALSIRYRF
jgi:hypothetical protein